MKVITYFCDICKKRIRNNQKVWFGGNHEYHFWCKYRQEQPLDQQVMARHGLPKNLSEYK